MSKVLISSFQITSKRTFVPRLSLFAHHTSFQSRKMSSGKDDIAESAAATLVEYKRLGNSGLRVSMPIFGCMRYVSFYQSVCLSSIRVANVM